MVHENCRQTVTAAAKETNQRLRVVEAQLAALNTGSGSLGPVLPLKRSDPRSPTRQEVDSYIESLELQMSRECVQAQPHYPDRYSSAASRPPFFETRALSWCLAAIAICSGWLLILIFQSFK